MSKQPTAAGVAEFEASQFKKMQEGWGKSNAELFISELYRIGWDSPLDAQHRKITKLLGEWNEPLRNPEQLESSHSRTIEHLDKWISRAHKAEETIRVLEAEMVGFRKGCRELIDKWRQIYFIDNNQHGLVSGDTTYANDLEDLIKEQSK